MEGDEHGYGGARKAGKSAANKAKSGLLSVLRNSTKLQPGQRKSSASYTRAGNEETGTWLSEDHAEEVDLEATTFFDDPSSANSGGNGGGETPPLSKRRAGSVTSRDSPRHRTANRTGSILQKSSPNTLSSAAASEAARRQAGRGEW